MLIVGIVPIFTGQINWANFSPLVPLAAAYAPEPGSWNNAGWTLVLGGMFIAAWSTYGFETAVCYTSEFRNPGTDTFKAIFYSGLLCMLLFILVPFTFQGVLGFNGMLAPDRRRLRRGRCNGQHGRRRRVHPQPAGGADDPGADARHHHGDGRHSRTLYQGSVDGWLPRYLTHVNRNGAPTQAMWTDLTFNLLLLLMVSLIMTIFLFVLAVSNVCYIVFNFLNLNAGWIHRIDNAHVKRPWKAPDWLLGAGRRARLSSTPSCSAPAPMSGVRALTAGIYRHRP